MSTNKLSYNDYTNDSEVDAAYTPGTPNLFQLFSLDLAHCPRFNRADEYALACQTRAAWLRLVRSFEEWYPRLAHIRDMQHLTSPCADISEPDLLRALRCVQTHVDQFTGYEVNPKLASLQSWLAQMQADLAQFRDCRNEMVQRNLRFVVMLARRYHRSGGNLLDLIQEGTLGLLRAVERFNPDRGVRFASYAVWWIRKALSRVLTSPDDTFCFSDTTDGEEPYASVIDVLAAPDDTTPEMAFLHSANATELRRALVRLPQQEADILRLRFALDGPYPCTLVEVGQRLGLTRPQVRLREQRALARLRAYLQHSFTGTQQHAQGSRRKWSNAA